MEVHYLLQEAGALYASQRLGNQPWEREKEGNRNIGENITEIEKETWSHREMEMEKQSQGGREEDQRKPEAE